MIEKYHMNEGHESLLALELFRDTALQASCSLDDFQACMSASMDVVRPRCVFTTHTPVAAGHDKFAYDLVKQVLGDFVPIDLLKKLGGEDQLNMTLLALNLSHYVNSVARQHQSVSAHLFPGYRFSAITNGVHSATWTAAPFAKLFDRHMPNWRKDSFDLRYALRIPEEEVWMAHSECKTLLVQMLNEKYHAGFEHDVFTIGFARRATAYKRAHLLFQDAARLRAIAQNRKIQLVFAGKAHPQDTQGKEIIQQIHRHISELKDIVKIVYIPDYDMDVAKVLVPGVDVWLNTPARPQEATGTSGMKAAHNGVPHLSVLDGWWVEGHIEGVTGWSVGPPAADNMEAANDDSVDAGELYEKLEHTILPMYYDQHKRWSHVMRNCIALNASFFNTHRMVQQYVLNAYLF
jgi:starch phosphorylase